MGTRVHNRKNAVLCADNTNEAVSFQFDYYGLLHGLYSFSIAHTEILSSSHPTHPFCGVHSKYVFSDRGIIDGEQFHAFLIEHEIDMYFAANRP